MRRHPRSSPRTAPLTRRRRLPGLGATAVPRFQQGAVSGVPLPGLKRWIPSCCGGLPPGAAGASPGLVRLSSDLPRPEASGGPAPPRLPGGARVAFGRVKTLGVRHQRLSQRSQHCRGRGHPDGLQDARSTLRPSGSPQVAVRLRPGRTTRYGWGASPSPTRPFTWPETPSVAWRDNARAQPRLEAAA
jgi:hypothetical protein